MQEVYSWKSEHSILSTRSLERKDQRDASSRAPSNLENQVVSLSWKSLWFLSNHKCARTAFIALLQRICWILFWALASLFVPLWVCRLLKEATSGHAPKEAASCPTCWHVRVRGCFIFLLRQLGSSQFVFSDWSMYLVPLKSNRVWGSLKKYPLVLIGVSWVTLSRKRIEISKAFLSKSCEV